MKTSNIGRILNILFSYLFISIGLNHPANAETKLADKPLFTSYAVPGNVALALSVEFPTAIGAAYSVNYSPSTNFLGYFDPDKCYDYNTNSQYFVPFGAANARICNGHWSGNFLNWALTQTIDPFRQVLTGGNRVIDNEDLTVLEKAWHSGQQGYAGKSLTNSTLITGATPFNSNSFSISLAGQGNKFTYNNGINATQVFARVQVCASEALKEGNCTKYPNGKLKPTGLIQKNATKLKFAAFGYGIQQSNARDGGVLRAKMDFAGPTVAVPGSSDIAKLKELEGWDLNTGIFNANPDPISASISGVKNSGVINYLNKFGSLYGYYKQFDPVSELYYSAIRYFKNQGNIDAYSSTTGMSAAAIEQFKDGFPVITKWEDPIKYSCQANFIIGVGDVNAWSDSNIPESKVKDYTDKVGQLEGLANLGSTIRSGRGDTYFIAGLAYDAHTVDMRPDITSSQTIKTYWLDVLEEGFVAKNQYWLATKYGGFDVPAGFNAYSSSNTAPEKKQWDANSDGDPDNYFRANNPKLMQENLTEAFDDILRNLTKSSSALAVTNQNITDGDIAYTSTYTVDGWSGDVTAKKTIVDASTGLVSTSSALWSAADKLQIRTPQTRVIASAKCTSSGETQSCNGIPFSIAALNTSGDSSFLAGLPDRSATDVLNYLRGDRTVITNNRKKVLGDITAAQPIVVGAPNAGYSDATNPGYAAFREKYKSRTTIIYSGANDGMLHAFAGGSSGGNELFAYVPQALFKGPSNPPTPNDDGLAALAKASYSHHAYVDKTPVVQDVNFGGGTDDWHSILVGGLGKGGKAYYAIDVTNPAALTDENQLASKVLWEFKHPNLGFSYGKPLIVKTKKDGWVVILASGYNNADGKGHLFILKAKDGSLIQQIETSGSTNSDGLAHVSAFINSFSDNTADAAYAGDLQGNLWRLDLTNTTAANYYQQLALVAQLKSNTGQAQPITTPPALALDSYTGKRYIFVGTGRLLDDTDITSTQEQSFYAILDGTRSKFFDAPASPITRNVMADNSDVKGKTLTNSQLGWYIDLGFGSNGNAYRINAPIVVSASVVAFAKNLPDNSDVCNPSGSAEGYGINYSTGKTVLPGGLIHVHIDGLVSLINMYNTTPYDKGVVLSFNSDGTANSAATAPCPNNQCRTVTSTNNFKTLNWREINAE